MSHGNMGLRTSTTVCIKGEKESRIQLTLEQKCIQYLPMIQSINERQLSLNLRETKPFVAPTFRRAPDDKNDLPGISPRDGFEFVEELVVTGMSEDEIAPKLVEFIQKKRSRIRGLLMRITNSRLAINFDQKMHAAELDNSLQEISELSIAWWMFEMNISQIIETPHKSSWPGVLKLIKDFRIEMGKFRTFMEKEYGVVRK